MGLPRAAVSLLCHVAANSPFSGRLATLGRQHVYVTADEVVKIAAQHGVSTTPCNATLHRDCDLRRQGFLSDDSLFETLGFEDCVRLDASAYENVDELLDLNALETPPHLTEAFDLILDTGTIEHVFDIRASLSNCLNMARPGGRIIHLTPSSNAVNHGFFSVSPTLFQDFYTASGCEVERLYLCRMSNDFLRGIWHIYDCRPMDRDWLPLGRLGAGIWCTFAEIRKGANAKPVIPQQGFYLSTWKASAGPNLAASEPSSSKAGRLLSATDRWPAVHSTAKRWIDRWRRFRNWQHERRRGIVPYPKIGDF